MADPKDNKPLPTVPSVEDTKAAADYGEVVGENVDKQKDFTQATDKAKEATKEVTEAYKGAKDGLLRFIKNIQTGTSLTDAQSIAIGKLSAQIFDSTKIFQNFGAAKLSPSFLEQYSDVSDIIMKDIFPMLNKGADAVNSVTQKLLGIKLPTDVISGDAAVIDNYLRKQFAAADTATKFRDEVLANAVATGVYGDVLDSVGDDLSNLNNLLENHNELMINAQKATGMTDKQIQSFYKELNKIPGAFNNSIATGGRFNQSMLSAVATLSTATRRSAAEIGASMMKAYQNYGVSDERALQFVARMSEASNNLKLPFNVVESFMEDIAGQVGMLGENIDASARILDTYAGSFTKLGLSADQAKKLISGMTSSVLQMNIAQKAFLSAQSGGPGGLMGGFRIDKMMRDGKLDEVMKMVESQMKRQFGRIVTLDEASQSPQAAAQLAKQKTLVQSGPLGKFAQNDSEAYRVLEALKNKDSKSLLELGNKKEMSKTPVQDFLAKGNSLQEQSITIFSQMASDLTAIKQRGVLSNLSDTQLRYSANPGGKITPGTPDLNAGMRGRLKANALGAREKGEELSEVIRTGFENKRFLSNQNNEASLQLRSLSSNLAKDSKDIAMAQINAGKMVFGSKNLMEEEQAKLDEKYSREKLSPKPNEETKKVLDLRKQKDPLEMPEDVIKALSVRKSAETVASNLTKRNEDKMKEKQEHDVHVDVKFDGVCIHCREKMQAGVSAQQKASNAGNAANQYRGLHNDY